MVTLWAATPATFVVILPRTLTSQSFPKAAMLLMDCCTRFLSLDISAACFVLRSETSCLSKNSKGKVGNEFWRRIRDEQMEVVDKNSRLKTIPAFLFLLPLRTTSLSSRLTSSPVWETWAPPISRTMSWHEHAEVKHSPTGHFVLRTIPLCSSILASCLPWNFNPSKVASLKYL